MRKTLYTYIFILLNLVVSNIYANSFRDQEINIKDKLSSRRVFQIEKDSAGFMWFFTYMGIDRFDGSEMRKYKLINSKMSEESYLPNSKMVVDKYGCLWVGMLNGNIFKYDKDIDDFRLVLDIRSKVSHDNLLMTSYIFDKKNRLWLCTNDGVYIYDLSCEKLMKTDIVKDISPNRCITIAENKYFLGTDQGIICFEESSSMNFKITNEYKDYQLGVIENLYYFDNKLYIASSYKGLSVLDLNTKKIDFISTIPNVPIRVIVHTKDDEIVVGLDGAGVYILDANSNKQIKTYVADNDSEKGLKSNSVYDLLVDDKQQIWVATYSDGINIIKDTKPYLEQIKHEYKNKNSLVNNTVNSLFEDSMGNLWFGTNNGVSIYESHKKKWKHYLDKDNETFVVLAIKEDKNRNVWLGGYGMGVYSINPQTGKINRLKIKTGDGSEGLSSKHIYSIFLDESRIWFGALDGNMTEYNPNTGTYYYHNFQTSSIKPLNDSILICATYSGFIVFDKLTRYFKAYSIQDNPLNYNVTSMHIASQRYIWLATEGGGIVCYDLETETKVCYSIESGLNSNYIYSIIEDDNKIIWVSTEKGISYIDPISNNVVNIGEYIGINAGFNNNVSIKCRNGDLIFGTSEGAIKLNPIYQLDIKSQGKLIFTDFRLFYNSVKPNEKAAILSKAIDVTEFINLKYDQNSFSFTFSSINFDMPERFVYLYKLDGFDKDWITALNKNANYTNINPANYNFTVRLIDKESGKIIDERSVKIFISQPFWLSGWAFLIYGILMLLLGRLIVQYIRGQIEKQNAKDKIHFFVNVAHDIKTPVSLIKAPLEDIQDKEELSELGSTSLNIAIRNTEKLFKIVTKLLDFQRMDAAPIKLHITSINIYNFLSEKITLFTPKARRKQIILSLKSSDESLYVNFDYEKLDIIISNLLSNAIKYTLEGGNITIEVNSDKRKWYLTVSDTGIGIPVSEQKYLFKSFFRAANAMNSKETGTGIGLLMVKKLVKLHQGSISIRSEESIGTICMLTFPRKNNKIPSSSVRTKNYDKENQDLLEIAENVNNSKKENSKSDELILLVEDNDDMRTFLRNTLSSDYRIVEAKDGKDALEFIEKTHPSLIVSDVLLSEINGDEMCSILKNNIATSHIPIVLLTALGEKENMIEGLSCGADDYITKPFDISILKARIKNILINRSNLKSRILAIDKSNVDVDSLGTLDRELLEKAFIIVNLHLDNIEFTVKEFCAEMGMSQSSLYNKLKALTDQGPNDFIRVIRLNKAAELLQSGRYNVSEVSTMTGFLDSKYFSTVFKKQFGVSPSKYNL